MKNWQTLLSEAVEADPRGRSGVADAIGVSRSAISQLLSGSYPADPEPMGCKVIDVYGRYICPHLDIDISPRQCSGYARRVFPTSNPRESRHWRACQNCHLKPEKTHD